MACAIRSPTTWPTRDASDRIRYTIDELIRERVFAMAIGASAQDDVDRLAHDPAFRVAVWNRTGDAVASERLASQPTQSRLIDILTADGMQRFVGNVDQKAHEIAVNIDYRLDAGYTTGDVMDDLSAKKRRFVGRLKSNRKLDTLAAKHLVRPAGRGPAAGYESIVELGPYQVDSWRYPQRLILVVVDHPDPATGQLNLMPRYFFLVTNWPEESRSGEALLEHYRKRGTFEDRLGEFNETIGVHLSSRQFQENEATMLLAMLAFNLTSACRNELEDSVGGCWDLTRFQQFVLKVGGELIKHSRRLMLRIAESAEPLWSRLTARLEGWLEVATPSVKRHGFTPPPEHAHLNEVLRL